MRHVHLIFSFGFMVLVASFFGCASDAQKVEEVASEASAAPAADMASASADKAADSAKKMPTTKASTEAKAASAPVSEGQAACTLGADTRKIWVEKVESGCVVKYEKNGEVQDVASAAHAMTHCDEVKSRIATNLGNAGFNCQ